MNDIFGNNNQGQTQQPAQGQGYNDAPANQDDPFDRIGGANVSKGGVYPLPGVYPVVQVDKLVMKKNRNNEDIFIAELDILQSNVPERVAGSSMSWICNLTKHKDMAPGNVRGFIAALMNVATEQVGSNEARIACGPGNPCHGRLVRLEAVNIKTKNTGNDFTKCNWQPIADDGQAQAAELRAAAGFPPF